MAENIHTCNKEAEIATIQATVNLLGPNLEKLIDAKFTAVHATIKANHYIEMLEFRKITDRQDISNGRTSRLEQTQRGYQAVMTEVIKNQRYIRWIQKHPVKSILISLAVVGILIAVADWIGLRPIISYLK